MLRQFCAVRNPISAETGIETAHCACVVLYHRLTFQVKVCLP